MRHRKMKRVLALLLAAVLTFGLAGAAFAQNVSAAEADTGEEVKVEEGDKPFVSLGADLKENERQIVLDLLGLTEEDLENCDVIKVTNAKEHEMLDEYIPSERIGNRALSSVVVMAGEKGSGIKVTTKNINYCTKGMYENALATAGVEDAEVIVAGPFEISGTAALIGAINAYSVMSGDSITTDVIDGAIDEIVTTGEIEASSDEDAETIEGMIAYVKEQIAENGNMSDDEIKDVIDEAQEKFNITLTQEQIDQLLELLKKLQGLDIDWDNVKKHATTVYEKLKESGFDISKIDTEQVAQQASGLFARIIAFIKNLLGL